MVDLQKQILRRNGVPGIKEVGRVVGRSGRISDGVKVERGIWMGKLGFATGALLRIRIL
jgi:hypothetical protein